LDIAIGIIRGHNTIYREVSAINGCSSNWGHHTGSEITPMVSLDFGKIFSTGVGIIGEIGIKR
jgi:hypothetical protein